MTKEVLVPRLLLLGPPGADDEVPTVLGESRMQRNVLWSDGSRSLALAGALPTYGPVVHLMDAMDGRPWDPAHQFTTLGTAKTPYGLLHAGHFPRLGFTVYAMDSDIVSTPYAGRLWPNEPAAWSSVLVMAGPYDVTDDPPSWHWVEDLRAADSA